MNELALFAGAGGGLLGGRLLGWHTVCAVEIDPYCRKVLLQRQRDGVLPEFPIWDDVRTFEGTPWRGAIDIISGGFPCQDISAAGRGKGLAGERSGLWAEFARIIGEVGPRYVFVENSPLLVSRGLDRVLGDLAAMGYDARWGVLGACHAGAPHRRERIWILATNAERGIIRDESGRSGGTSRTSASFAANNGEEGFVADANGAGLEGRNGRVVRERSGELPAGKSGALEDTGCLQEGRGTGFREEESRRAHSESAGSGWWEFEPDVGRVADGVAARVDKLRALGNGQVPAVAALAWRILNEEGRLEAVPRRVTRKQILEELLCH